MATTTPGTKTIKDAPKRRGPRRTTPPATRPASAGPDLEQLRTDLYAAILEEHPGAELTAVGEAFDLAVAAHEGQLRATGEPYVVHPIASAQILAELGIDPIAIQAALLHDVPEDTEFALSDVEEKF